MASVKAWFPTLIYCERLQTRGLQAFNLELLDECYRIRDYDEPGRAWSASNYPPGYTSYGSLDQLHRVSSTFDTLRARIDAHVAAYARELDWDLRGGRLSMSDCWLSIMPRGCAHSFHVHPQSVVSGTYYVATPAGCAGLKFEDPRMTNFMAAPSRKSRGRADQRAHISYPARVGNVILFESWLRHEVPPSQIDEDRISISFNYHWN